MKLSDVGHMFVHLKHPLLQAIHSNLIEQPRLEVALILYECEDSGTCVHDQHCSVWHFSHIHSEHWGWLHGFETLTVKNLYSKFMWKYEMRLQMSQSDSISGECYTWEIWGLKSLGASKRGSRKQQGCWRDGKHFMAWADQPNGTPKLVQSCDLSIYTFV